MPAKGTRRPDHDRRSSQITFWVTPAERDRISHSAERAGVSMSAYIRSLALGKDIRPKPSLATDELMRELTRIGNNLTQLMGHARDGKVPAYENLEHVWNRVSRMLDFWAVAKPKKPIMPDRIIRLRHEGSRLNAIARQANSGKPVAEQELNAVLHDLTEKLRPFAG